LVILLSLGKELIYLCWIKQSIFSKADVAQLNILIAVILGVLKPLD
tara:strand:+ start:1807 stop:1944 length:138 start_codon:yes stop_codon:yes gene_type:complete